MRQHMLLLIGAIALTACSSTEPSQKTSPAKMTVDFAWKPSHLCSGISPKIEIGNFPASTAYFAVRLRDRDNPESALGGGEVANTSSGTLPEGTLKSYTGPCTQGSEPHYYYFEAAAIDHDGKSIGYGKSKVEPLP
ncbi:MAG: MbtF [Rhodospirillaceae bacterium]|nr:MAG: MbtF [Rhodospirillaceae bacterium]